MKKLYCLGSAFVILLGLSSCSEDKDSENAAIGGESGMAGENGGQAQEQGGNGDEAQGGDVSTGGRSPSQGGASATQGGRPDMGGQPPSQGGISQAQGGRSGAGGQLPLQGGNAPLGGNAGQGEGGGSGSLITGGSAGQGQGGDAGGSAGQAEGGSAIQGGSAGQAEGGSATQGGSAGQAEGGSAIQGGSAGQGEGGSAGSGGASNPGGEFGFIYRSPQQDVLQCSDESSSWQLDDADWLCTFDNREQSGYVYVQSTPVECAPLGYPIYQTQLAQLSLDGDVEPLTNAQLETGNHAAYLLSFDYDGKNYSLAHSSIDFAYHACQNMDCMRIMEGSTLIEDGCTKARSLPVVCVPILPDLTHEPLIDTFAPCPGDPNYE